MRRFACAREMSNFFAKARTSKSGPIPGWHLTWRSVLVEQLSRVVERVGREIEREEPSTCFGTLAEARSFARRNRAEPARPVTAMGMSLIRVSFRPAANSVGR
jgi:hypothetical protein